VLAWSGWRDCSGFLYSGVVVVGAVWVKWWGGGLALFSFYIFFILLLILLVGGCLWQVFVLQYWFFLVTIGTIRGVVVMNC
jgi:hypothetical protein